MTRVFTEDGVSRARDRHSRSSRTVSPRFAFAGTTDGYAPSRWRLAAKGIPLTKAEAGHFAKVGVEAGRGPGSFRLDDHKGGDGPEVGAEITQQSSRSARRSTCGE